MTILFVCSGNTCRSPLAVAAWHALEAAESALGQRGDQVSSAGLMAHKGAPATPHAQQIARHWNTDLLSHRARGLTQELAQDAALIVTMTQQQAQTARRQFALPTHRVRVLGEFRDAYRVLDDKKNAEEPSDDARLEALMNDATTLKKACEVDIADPFGGSLEAYESCASQIKNAVAGLRFSLRNGDIVP